MGVHDVLPLLEHPGIWIASSTAAAAAISVIRAKISARRDVEIIRIALHGTKPKERPPILRSLGRLRPLSSRTPPAAYQPTDDSR